MPLTGEQIQQLGDQGGQRAKRWLESTCRAEVKWNNPTAGVSKLQYKKAGAPIDSPAQGDYFSFDLGGNLLGGDAEGDLFLAESKKYAKAHDQAAEYRKFLSKCYSVEGDFGAMFDYFLWITWAPFNATRWDEIVTPEWVEAAVDYDDHNKYIALEPASGYDPIRGAAVAKKVIIVVLADGQEVLLSLHGDELLHVKKSLIDIRGDT